MPIEGLASEHDIADWRRLNIIQNTQVFSLYLKWRKQFCEEFIKKINEPDVAKFILTNYANEARNPLEYIEQSMNKLQLNGSLLLGNKETEDRYLKAYERYKENRLFEQQIEQSVKANDNEQKQINPVDIWVTPGSGLFGKVIPIKIGDIVKVGLYGVGWKPGSRPYARNSMRPLNSNGTFIDEAKKKTVFIFTGQAPGKEELEFTSESERTRIVMGVTIIVTG